MGSGIAAVCGTIFFAREYVRCARQALSCPGALRRSASGCARVNAIPSCSCTATAFGGFEAQILQLRNSNREHGETLDYLKWRYRSTAAAPDPRVYWLLDPAESPIGMASAIFRPYSINAATGYVAVIGDISLDVQWRGRGLGRTLLQFMT